MKNIYDVLRQKEADLQRIQKDIEALRITARLLEDESDAQPEAIPKLVAVGNDSAPAPQRVVSPGMVKEGGYSSAWDNAPSPRPFP